MPYVRNLDDASPPARFDSLPFTKALIQESSTVDGVYSTLSTITLSSGAVTPASSGGVTPTGNDADPANPQNRDLTTSAGVLTAGYLRVVWQDAAGSQFVGDSVYFPSAGSSGDLTTLTAVRAFLQRSASEDEQDVVLASLITRASQSIQSHCQREFTPSNGEARIFNHRGGSLLSLAPYDLRTVTSIELDTQGDSETTLSATDYALRPIPAKHGVFQWVRFPSYPSTDVDREVTITGHWGFESVPEDVEHWAIITVVLWLRRDVSSFETNFSIPEDRIERPRALPSSVVAGLSHYKRGAL